MLRPRPETTLPAIQTPASLTELPTWNPLTPVQELPQKLQQLRQAQQQLNQMLADAEGQVLHFLRKGPLAGQQKAVKELIERFYPFTASLLKEHYMNLTAGGISSNVCIADFESSIKQIDNGFQLDWDDISNHTPNLRKVCQQYLPRLKLNYIYENIDID